MRRRALRCAYEGWGGGNQRLRCAWWSEQPHSKQPSQKAAGAPPPKHGSPPTCALTMAMMSSGVVSASPLRDCFQRAGPKEAEARASSQEAAAGAPHCHHLHVPPLKPQPQHQPHMCVP